MNHSGLRRPRKPVTAPKILVYPEIHQAADTLEDSYWRERIQSLCYQDFKDKKIVFESKTTIAIKFRGVIKHRLDFSELSPQQTVEEFIKFLRDKSCERSTKDLSFEKPAKIPPPITNWSTAKQSDRDNLLRWYIEDLRDKYQLTRTETMILRTHLILCHALKELDNNSVVIRDGMIYNITILRFELPDRRWVRVPTQGHRVRSSKKDTRQVSKFYAEFNKQHSIRRSDSINSTYVTTQMTVTS